MSIDAPLDAPSDLAVVAASVVEQVLGAPPTIGPGRLICIDGPAGTGKTTLSTAIAALSPAAQVVHCDDLLHGWHGLPGLARTVADLLEPVALGGPGRWRRWDWLTDDWAENHTLEPGGLLVLEGVGSWSPEIAPWVGMLVWVDAPSDLRLLRGIERDGEEMRPQWEQWQCDEDDLFARLATRDHADLVVSTG